MSDDLVWKVERPISNSSLGSQLHFAKPTVYNEIYNSQNKWDKDYTLYRAFDLDESFFCQTDYLKSKHSRTLVSNLFSKSAVVELQHLIRGQVRSIRISRSRGVNSLIGFIAGSFL